MRPGDIFVLCKLSRLCRNAKQLIETVQLLQEKGIELKSLTESIDTTSAAGKLLFHFVADFAQFVRDNMIENTKAGLDAARARGQKRQRPTKLDAKKAALTKELAKDESHSVHEICALLQINRTTYYKYTANTVV